MNDALSWLGNQGFHFNNVGASKKVIMDFIGKYASMFYRITGGVTPENVYELAYNATVGLAISYKMQKYKTNSKYNDYDQEIGFWVSFYDKAMGFNMKFSDISESHLGLVEFGNLIKSIIMQEGNFQQFVNGKPKGHDFVNGKATRWGLMAVGVPETQGVNANILRRIFGSNAVGIQEADIKESGFYNIGAGMGHLMGKLGVSGRNPTGKEWKSAVKAYNGGGADADSYLNQVWERFEKYNEESYKKRNH